MGSFCFSLILLNAAQAISAEKTVLYVEKAQSVCAETVRGMLSVAQLSRTADMAECVGQGNSGSEETLSGVCVRNLGDTGD